MELCESGDVCSSAGTLGATPNSEEVVPESGNGVDSVGMGMFGANPMEAKKLELALKVGEIVGMTCEGQTGQLNEVMGKLFAENRGRGTEGVGGNHVINES